MNGIPKSPVTHAFPQIQWDALGSLRLTAQETALLRMAETNPIDYTLSDSRDASMYARVLLKLLAEAHSVGAGTGVVSKLPEKCTDEEAMSALKDDPLGIVSHYALTKLYEIITTLNDGVSGVTITSVFYVGKEGVLVDQWKALLRVLNKGGKGDIFAQKVASLSLAKILLAAFPSQRQKTSTVDKDGNPVRARQVSFASATEPAEALAAWVASQLKNTSGAMVGVCIPSLKALMEAHESRVIFCKSGGIKYISRQLRAGSKTTKTLTTSIDNKKKTQTSVQQLYELVFCLWVLTYELNASYQIRADFAKDGLPISALVDMVSIAPREKVVRVALSSLRNMATCDADNSPQPSGQPRIDDKHFLGEMIACGLMKAVDHLRDRQFTDPDIVEDVKCLHKLLIENYKEMSRWEVYKNEIEAGHLQWGSVHTEAFFKENARMMEGSDGDFRPLKVLIALLSSTDEEISAIACFDIGEFVRHYPNGRAIAKRLGAKELVMPLIEHENPELQRHALQCVSKIMVNNWEYVK
ncbi:Probable V-type proton ATPase subunit H 2 [Seminavis robusta]|uniref:Probable V-type proton ATPase subunit H 2 n=1 Tax=Seminavis robusta TaxID=568900 RepID=A0A9N8E6S4_9STRA|nr:Probable V-type proton ATPase subunit H 2 [Seminavis robusta]|eukprot:Sro556_g166000.1 Probable V-type proton ATPase subunit H 2 (526) ;mRNA; r:45128-46807